ncbi:MAG: hypothetical protein EA405_13065 [Rhodospirillales bacterium]|nr:MAG: hypothetical protein EA405_13065 [Rhodospirillales bacterium]
MQATGFIIAFWVALLLISIPVALRTRHPDQKPLAAVAIFIFVFTLVAAGLYLVVSTLVALLGLSDLLRAEKGVAVFLVVVFAPAFVMARWQVHKPPRRAPPLE